MGTRLTVFPRARVGGRCAGWAATPTSCSRSSTASRSSRRCGLRRRGSRSCTTSTSDHYVDRARARGRDRRAPGSRRCRCAALPRHAVPDDLATPRERDLVALGVPPSASTSPTSASSRRSSTRAHATPEPALLYLGRLKQYKRHRARCSTCSRASRARAGDRRRGRPPPALEAEIDAARAAATASSLHGHVDEEEKARAVRARLGQPDRVLGRGLVPDGDGGRGRAARRARRCASAACPSRSSTARPALLADDAAGAGRDGRAARGATPSCASELGEAARARAPRASPGSARRAANLDVLERAAAAERASAARRAARARRPARPPAWPRRRWPTTRSQLVFTVALRAPAGRRRLRRRWPRWISTFLILCAGGQSLQVAAAREIALGRLGTDARARGDAGVVDARRLLVALRGARPWSPSLAARAARAT